VSKLTRSAYGLDAGADIDWRLRGGCASGQWDWDWWTDRSVGWQRRRWAIWVCDNECPVRPECLQWATDRHPLRAGTGVPVRHA
jgi:hypothetical protein